MEPITTIVDCRVEKITVTTRHNPRQPAYMDHVTTYKRDGMRPIGCGYAATAEEAVEVHAKCVEHIRKRFTPETS